MADKTKEITEAEKLLKDNPQWGIMRKWSLQVYINQLKGEPLPPHPEETQPIQPTTPPPSQPVSSPIKEIPTPPKSTTSKPKPSKSVSHIDELKKKLAQGKLKPSEIKKQKKQTLKQWLEESKISEEKYELLNEWLDQSEVFSLAEINAKYWELKDKE